jgi:hypothetical protein
MEKKSNSELNGSDSNDSSTNSASSIKVGGIYSVKRLDGEWVSAEVLETRINELKGKTLEYFVHFENSKSLIFFLILLMERFL